MQPIRLKAFEPGLQNDPVFQVAKFLLTDWQTLLTSLTNGDIIYWKNVDANCFVCEFGGIKFSVEERPDERIVRIGEVGILNYDREDYGSDKLLNAIWNQQNRRTKQQSEDEILDRYFPRGIALPGCRE